MDGDDQAGDHRSSHRLDNNFPEPAHFFHVQFPDDPANEEPRDDEEHVHADEPAGEPVEARMKEDDGKDGEGTKAVAAT